MKKLNQKINVNDEFGAVDWAFQCQRIDEIDSRYWFLFCRNRAGLESLS